MLTLPPHPDNGRSTIQPEACALASVLRAFSLPRPAGSRTATVIELVSRQVIGCPRFSQASLVGTNHLNMMPRQFDGRVAAVVVERLPKS
jgi:hypothetical protein